MNEFKLDLEPILDKAKREAHLSLENGIKSSTSNVIRTFMTDGRYGGPEGLGHEIVRKRVEEYILSPAFTNAIDLAIGGAANEQIQQAVKTLLNSKTRKVLFEAASDA